MINRKDFNLVSRVKNYFKSVDIPLWFKIFNLIILVPILLCPYVFFTTIFFFDNPKNLFLTFLLFLAVNAYPLYLALLAIGNYKLYRRNKYLSFILPLIFLFTISGGTIYIILSMKQALKEQKESVNDLGLGFRKDSLHVYYNDTIVKDADPTTFEVINGYWEKDTHSYYAKGKLFPGIDSTTFQILDIDQAMDKNNVYFENYIIEGADVKTYRVQGDYCGKDTNGCYKQGKRVDCSDLVFRIKNDEFKKRQ